MGRPAITEVPAASILEVQAFLRQRKALDEWKKKHAKALGELAKIFVAYNPCLTAAEKAVKEQRVTCGPFHLKYFNADRDAVALRRVLGVDEFERRGGSVAKIEAVEMDKERFDAIVSTLPEETQARVVSYAPVYDKPKLLVLP